MPSLDVGLKFHHAELGIESSTQWVMGPDARGTSTASHLISLATKESGFRKTRLATLQEDVLCVY